MPSETSWITLEANRSRCVGMAANMIGVDAIKSAIIVFVDDSDLWNEGPYHGDAQPRDHRCSPDGAFDTQEG